MKKHTQIYLKYFGYNISSWIGCEICDNKAVDIHHIENKGMGGSNTKDYIENLIALCRDCHIKAHNEKICKEVLKHIHNEKLRTITS